MTNFICELITALVIVESHGDWSKIGDDGQAFGGLQIHEEIIEDVNRIYHTHFVHVDAFLEDRAKMICLLWFQGVVGQDRTAEEYARSWNGGPRGPLNHSTISYWEKVQQHLFSLPGEPQGDQR